MFLLGIGVRREGRRRKANPNPKKKGQPAGTTQQKRGGKMRKERERSNTTQRRKRPSSTTQQKRGEKQAHPREGRRAAPRAWRGTQHHSKEEEKEGVGRVLLRVVLLSSLPRGWCCRPFLGVGATSTRSLGWCCFSLRLLWVVFLSLCGRCCFEWSYVPFLCWCGASLLRWCCFLVHLFWWCWLLRPPWGWWCFHLLSVFFPLSVVRC